MKEADLGWAAGLIDGSGTISRPKHLTSRTDIQRHLFLSVSTTDRYVLERLQSLFGGRVHGPYLRGMYRWRLSTQAALTHLLTSLRPYLTAKREDADAALRAYTELVRLVDQRATQRGVRADELRRARQERGAGPAAAR